MENKKNCWFLLTLNRDLFSNVIMNLYITNDDSITENDYYINSLDNAIRKGSLYNHPYHHKIILTTDINLIENGVQAIEDKFLQLFCSKNGKVDFVDVKTEKVINYSFPRSVYDKYIITVPDEKSFPSLKKESFELPFPQLLKEFSNYYIGYDPIEDSEQDTETIEKLHKSQISLDSKKSKYNCWLLSSYNKSSYDQNLDLYITNDEVVTKDDYYVNSLDNKVRGKGNDSNYSYHHKVVLTTNDTLIKNGVQGLSNEYLEKINSEIHELKFVELRYMYQYDLLFTKIKVITKRHTIEQELFDLELKFYIPLYLKFYNNKNEKNAEIKQSDLWNDIYKILKRNPMENISKESIDVHSVSTLIESLFKKMQIKNNQIELLKENIESIHLYLNDLNIPRRDSGNIEYSIVDRIKKIENKLNENMKAIETQTRYTKQDIIEFAKWIATPELHGYGKQLYETKTRYKVDKLEDLIDIWLKQNNKNMEEEQNKLYDIHLQLSYGELLIEGIEAGSEEEAIDIAIEKATNELSYAKTSVLRKRDKI